MAAAGSGGEAQIGLVARANSRLAGKDTQTVVSALIKQAKKLPKELYKSLTWDRGKELTDHRRFTLATKIDVYFCDPQSPWQRGSNENTNGLLRQYFPKGTDLSVHSQTYLNKWLVSSRHSLFMRWNVIAAFINLNPSILEAVGLFGHRSERAA
jgi:hypothetical protein